MDMNSEPPSSAPIPPTFQENGVSAQFLEWMESRAAELTKIPELLRKDIRKDWSQTVSSLLSVLFLQGPDELRWGAMHEQVKFTEVSLQIIYHAAKGVPSLFAGEETLAQALFTVITIICTTLDLWIDVDPPPQPGYLSPLELYKLASKTASTVLQALGDEVVPAVAPTSRQLMKEVVNRCRGIVNDLLFPQESDEYPKQSELIINPSTADYIAERIPQLKSNKIHVGSSEQIPLVVSCLLEVCLKALTPTATNHWFLMDFVRDTCQFVGQIHDYFFVSCVSAGPSRYRAVARVSAALSSFAASTEFPEFAEAYWSKLLRYRLETGPDIAWEGIESDLAADLRASKSNPRNRADLLAVVQVLHAEEWAEEGSSLRDLCEAYVTLFVPSLDQETLFHINGLFDTEAKRPFYQSLLEIMGSRLQNLQGPVQEAPTTTARRILAQEAVNKVIEPRVLDWMDDDGNIDDTDFIRRCLSEVDDRFEKDPPWNTTMAALEALAKNLSELPCLLFHANDQCTPATNDGKDDICFIAVYLKVAFRILECDDSRKVRPRVYVAVYNALGRSLRHQTSLLDERLFEDLTTFIVRGMRDRERGVRLAAGRALVDLVKLVQRIEGASEYVLAVFQKIHPLLRHADNPVRETSLVTVGLIGKATSGLALRESVCALVFQMGQYNPVLKGTATLQLHSLARHYEKSPYNLVMPYQDTIAPYLVRRMISEPYGIAEFCDFVSMVVPDFIRMTFKHTLPRLFADGDLKLLEAVAASAPEPKTVALLTLDQAHHILSHTFMLQGIGQTARTLKFITAVLKSAGQDPAAITTASIVFSSLLPTLTEIVSYLGDDDPDVTEAARQGLRKIARVFEDSGTTSKDARLATILEDNMLGIITNLNDMLQVHGKLSIEAKQRILRSFGEFSKLVGNTITNIAPQIMATLQTMLLIPQLCDAALSSWFLFIAALGPKEIGPLVGPTSASFVAHWSTFSERGRRAAEECIKFMVVEQGRKLGSRLAEIADLSSIPELKEASDALTALRLEWTPHEHFTAILNRLDSENLIVAVQSAIELRARLLGDGEEYLRSLTVGDAFGSLVGELVAVLYRAACRDGDGTEALHVLAFECMGIIGAVDPDRFEIPIKDTPMLVISNFTDESEAITFALHLIQTVLVGAYRSTRDIKYQSYLGFTIQELLRFCGFSPALVKPLPQNSNPVQKKARNRWSLLPKFVLETVTPLLESKFSAPYPAPVPVTYPIYPSHPTYRQWVQAWTSDLINKVSGVYAKKIFRIFAPVVRNKDVGVAHHLLPYLVLNVIASGDQNAQAIQAELLAVLQDQVKPDSQSSPDKKLLSAQTVFMLLDHLNKWIRTIRQDLLKKRESDSKRASLNSGAADVLRATAEEQLVRVDSILSNIDQGLMANAASQCKAYARALMNLEHQIRLQRETNASKRRLQRQYERLHELYALLEEPDGMEGVSPLILSPSLEHQIREHESTGRWTSAQSCWEVRLQHDPDNLDSHLGLLRCLRNLGHYDSLRTHVKGVLTRNPEWGPQLIGYQIESEWMVGHWDEVQNLVDHTEARPSQVLIAQVLLALRSGKVETIATSLSQARLVLGSSITASGQTGYGRSYDAVLDLHLVHELELISKTVHEQTGNQDIEKLSSRLAARFESTLPSFRIREPILNMRRTALKLRESGALKVDQAIGKLWLDSAKIARKAGHTQTAYSALLQAQQSNAPFSFIESAKLIRSSGEPMRALQELEKAMQIKGIFEAKGTQSSIIEITANLTGAQRKAKANMLLARWIEVSERWDSNKIIKTMQAASGLWEEWESGHFHVGQFCDEVFKGLSPEERRERGYKLNRTTVKSFTAAIALGSKYTYQTLPRVLTIWLDMSVDKHRDVATFDEINNAMDDAIKKSPVYKWYTAFPQIVSRISVQNETAYNVLAKLISAVIREYPQQALWFFTAVVHSTSQADVQRRKRSKIIMQHLQATQNGLIVEVIRSMGGLAAELINLCHLQTGAKVLNTARSTKLTQLVNERSMILIPLQESLTANLPPSSAAENTHQPFPTNPPTFVKFYDDIHVMPSMAKPKKLLIIGSDGRTYTFLAKKDDLRKDGRLMDFDAILNKLLKADSDARRRQLKIRTYGVVSLTEECGMIQWVPNTMPIRTILEQLYARRGWSGWHQDKGFTTVLDRIKVSKDSSEATKIFVNELLPKFPPVLHEWFVETFSEPALWLASRKAFSRTAAVMSMVGYILGLGDRHLENILLDTVSGDVVHVDFDCLFEKGQLLEVPEIVPFRLTRNIVTVFGVTGVEGVFRISCEVTLRLLRENKDCLMNVLDAFVHDPLLEWIERRHREHRRKGQHQNQVSTVADLRALSLHALGPIEDKLDGRFKPCKSRGAGRHLSVINHVQALVQEAMDPANLSRMYWGWAPYQ